MERKKYISFGEYLLDETNEILGRGSQTISMRPKVFAVLKFLLMHAGQLVTREQGLIYQRFHTQLCRIANRIQREAQRSTELKAECNLRISAKSELDAH